METIKIEEMRADFSVFLERVAKGEELLIVSDGTPVAKLVPVPKTATPRVPGYWKGKVRIAPDFDVLPHELAAAFRGDAQ